MASINGTNNADTLIGGPLDDVIRARNGDDILVGGLGNDRLLGGRGEDILYDGAGRDRMTGGADADIFVLGDDGEKDVITDFEDGIDLIDIRADGVDDFSDLTLTQLSNGRVRVDYGNDFVIVKGGLSVADLTADDFIFDNHDRIELDFEGLSYPDLTPGPYDTTYGGQLGPQYAGFEWSGMVFGVEGDETPASGLDNSSGSGDNAIVNGFAAAISFSDDTPFDFEQVEMGALYRDGLEVTIEGKLNGQVVGTQTVVLNTGGSTTVQLDDAIFDVVDEVSLTPTGGSGTNSPTYMAYGPNEHFYMDDMVLFA